MFPSQLHFLTQNSRSLSFDCTWRMHSRASSLGSWRSLPCSDANSEVCTGLCHAQRWCLEGTPPWSQVTLRKWFSEWNIQVPLLPRYTVYKFKDPRVQQYFPHVPIIYLQWIWLGASLIKPCLVAKPPLKYGYGESPDPFPQPAATKSLPFALETHSKIQGSSKSNTWNFAPKNAIKWLSGA